MEHNNLLSKPFRNVFLTHRGHLSNHDASQSVGDTNFVHSKRGDNEKDGVMSDGGLFSSAVSNSPLLVLVSSSHPVYSIQ
jgi:hypothetical protein